MALYLFFMANIEHVRQLAFGPESWARWRSSNQNIIPDLSGLNFLTVPYRSGKLVFGGGYDSRLEGYDLCDSVLDGAIFEHLDIRGVKLTRATLKGCNFSGVDFSDRDLSGCDFSGGNLSGCRFDRSDLRGARFLGCSLELASFAESNLVGANLSGSRIYGVSVWGGDLRDAVQRDMVIETSDGSISLDNIALAQFVYLLMSNEGVRSAIDTLASKTVLILGRFSLDRKRILDELKVYVRDNGYVPLMFDFDKPESRSLTETVRTLASISRFVLVDLTDPRSVPHELQMIVPHLTSVPVQPLIEEGNESYGMFEDYKHYPWVLPVQRYIDVAGDLRRVVTSAIGVVNEFIATQKK